MKKIIIGIIALMVLSSIVSGCASCADGCDGGGSWFPDYQITGVTYDYPTKTLSWYDNSPASKWSVTINDEKHETDTASYSYDAQGKDFTVKIEGLYEKAGSDINPKIETTFFYLESVTGHKVEDGNLKWNSVTKATGYQVSINGNSWTDVGSTCSYELPAGPFTAKVRPIVEGSGSYCDEPIVFSGVILSSPTTATYTDGTLAWDEVNGAEFYNVTINGNTQQVTGTSMSYDGAQQDLEISIAAGANSANVYSAVPFKTTFFYLPPVTEFSFDEQGRLTWPTSKNATFYEITLIETTGGEIQRTSLGTVETNVFDQISYNTPYTLEVLPRCDSGYTVKPTPFSFEVLSAVNNVQFKNGEITWDYHERAAEYEVCIINPNDNTKEVFKTTATSYKLGNIEKSIDIQVFAVGAGENCRSFTSPRQSYVYIPKVANLKVEDGILKWDASNNENVIGYTVKFVKNNDNSTRDVALNEFTDLIPNTQYVVQVIPKSASANCFSYWSGEFTFEILEAPAIRYQQGKILWNGNLLADGYTVRVTNPDGTTKLVELAKDTFAQDTSFITGSGEYQIAVKVKATKNNENLYDSAYSNSISITQLASVTGHKVDHSVNDINNFCFNIDPVPNASAYKVFVNEAEVYNGNSTNVRIDIESLVSNATGETQFTIEVLALGSTTANKIVLDAKTKYAFNVTKLATPQNLSFEGTTIKWDNVNHTSKYVISIDGTVYESTTAKYQLTTLGAGQHKVKVRAIAMPTEEGATNPIEYMTSNWSREITFTKLSAPSGVQLIQASGGKTHLRWTSTNEEAFGFAVKIGQSTPIDWDLTQYDISNAISSLKDGEGVQITVYAKGNGSTYMDSDPSETITIAKLAAPTNVNISGDNLTWTAPAIDGIVPNGYTLFVKKVGSTDPVEEIPVNGTTYRLADLPEGKLQIQVMALGNSTTTLNSSKSETATINKFPQVTNIRTEGTKYIWDAIDGATLYEISVDGVKYTTMSPEYDMADIFTTAKSYTVSIYAVGNVANNTVSSTPNTFTQTVSTLTAPRFVEGADPMALEAGTFTVQENGTSIIVTVKASEIVPVKYNFYIGGKANLDQVNNSFTYTIPMTGMEYQIQVSFSCGSFAAATMEGEIPVYYVNSNKSDVVTISVM